MRSRLSHWARAPFAWAACPVGAWVRTARPVSNAFVEILQAELVQAMAYTGRPTLASLNRSMVRTDFP